MEERLKLASYCEDRWLEAGGGGALHSAIDDIVVAETPAQPVNAASALSFARKSGGRTLRRLSFAERGKILRALADALSARKQELYELSFLTGATRADSAFDIEGGIGVLFYYSSQAKRLNEGYFLLDGDREKISKENGIAAQHFMAPLRGAAVHINAYNFPVWGMLEKLGPTLLAGVPAIIKPATATSWLAAHAFQIMLDSGALPSGAAQLIIGSTGNLVSRLESQDVLAFTGSAETAAKLRGAASITEKSVRFNSEQDSLNACILGPDARPGTPEFDLFVKEVAREITHKAGQKCTAIRRILAPADYFEDAEKAIAARLAKTTIGDPRNETVRMGALAGRAQRDAVGENLQKLRTETTAAFEGSLDGAIEIDPSKGAFMAPVLLRCEKPLDANAVHNVEAFGPVATVMPYTDIAEAGDIVNLGNGSLVMSAFSHDRTAMRELAVISSAFHGRMLLIDRDSAAESSGHGAALPHLVHGGPGRAGGGEEMAGLRGVKHYMQRTAIQASPEVLDILAAG